MARETRIGADKRENFRKVGGDRTAVALVALKRLAKCGARGNYEPSEAEIAKIESALIDEVARTVHALKHGYKGGTGGFKF